MTERGTVADGEAATPAVRLRGVVKEYPSAGGAVRVLDGLDLDVAPGRTVVVRGVSGSGKSTLLHVLAAIDQPTAGDVTVCGRDLTQLNRRDQAAFRADSIGFVFQFFNLMATLTAAENVTTGLEPLHLPRRERTRLADEALAAVGLTEHASKYPAQLSGGQQQRVAIARALAKRPPLLLADEPTGALDAATARQVMDCLRDVQAATGCAVVIATHDPTVTQYADETYRFDAGRLEAE